MSLTKEQKSLAKLQNYRIEAAKKISLTSIGAETDEQGDDIAFLKSYIKAIKTYYKIKS